MTDKIKEYLDKKMTQARREKAINNDMVTLLKMIDIYVENSQHHPSCQSFGGDAPKDKCQACFIDSKIEALLK